MNSSVGDLFYCNKSLIRKTWIFLPCSKRLRLASADPLESHIGFVSGRFYDSVKDPSERKRGRKIRLRVERSPAGSQSLYQGCPDFAETTEEFWEKSGVALIDRQGGARM